jgi:hypothetical protein
MNIIRVQRFISHGGRDGDAPLEIAIVAPHIVCPSLRKQVFATRNFKSIVKLIHNFLLKDRGFEAIHVNSKSKD